MRACCRNELTVILGGSPYGGYWQGTPARNYGEMHVPGGDSLLREILEDLANVGTWLAGVAAFVIATRRGGRK